MHQLIDSHCHLDLLLQHQPIHSILKACNDADIEKLVIPGLYPTQWHQIQSLCEQHSSLYFAIGIHPWFIQELEIEENQTDHHTIDLFEMIQGFIQHPKCIAIGECGLDGLIQTPIKTQISLLQQHIELANYFKKPIILHSRKTDPHLLQCLKKTPLDHAGVRHAFTGSVEQGQQLIDHNLYLGIGGSITYPRARKTIQAAKALPIERFLLETDSPDMPLNGFQGQINTPAQIKLVAEHLAQLREVSTAEIIQHTIENYRRLFGDTFQRQRDQEDDI